jgi:hypothetical protein
MKTVVTALVLLGLISPAQARPDWEAFGAGLLGALIIASMVSEEKPPPPPPPAKKDPRTVYLEHCIGYGFSRGWCMERWDGKDATRNSEPGVVINPIR